VWTKTWTTWRYFIYSYKNRIRAVQLYTKLGKCTIVTIRQLGYPTANALKSWHQNFEQERDLPKEYVRSKPTD
jgi:transposase-like protein